MGGSGAAPRGGPHICTLAQSTVGIHQPGRRPGIRASGRRAPHVFGIVAASWSQTGSGRPFWPSKPCPHTAAGGHPQSPDTYDERHTAMRHVVVLFGVRGAAADKCLALDHCNRSIRADPSAPHATPQYAMRRGPKARVCGIQTAGGRSVKPRTLGSSENSKQSDHERQAQETPRSRSIW